MRTAVIIDAVRTPVGRYGGALKDVRVDELAATCLGALVTRNHLDPASVEDVIPGVHEPGRRGQPESRADGAAARRVSGRGRGAQVVCPV
jgi:acetyl-CoA acetyltransferase